MAQADPEWTYLGDGRGGFYVHDSLLGDVEFPFELEEDDPWTMCDEDDCD